MKKRALISVSDKQGIVEFAKNLAKLDWEIISTGGTAKVLRKAGIKITPIKKITGSQEAFDGRMKTISFNVASGILFDRDNPEHVKQARALKIKPIDLIVVNLYPFYEVIKGNISEEDAVENIDIGGPTMIRAAAKNYKNVAVIINKKDYKTVSRELKKNGEIKEETRRKLALKVFELTSSYDSVIYNYFSNIWNMKKNEKEKCKELRYGENPHQKGVFCSVSSRDKLAIPQFKILQGKEISFNNIFDIDTALYIISKIGQGKPAATVIKHGNPCGAALANTIDKAFLKAWDGDSLSAFGGIICLNRKIDKKLASKMIKNFFEILLVPEITKDAEKVFKKKPNIRVLTNPSLKRPRLPTLKDLKSVRGGFLVQDFSHMVVKEKNLKIVTKKKPSRRQIKDLVFAFKVCEASKSNTITIVKNEQIIGNGMGQTARVFAARQALYVAGKRSKESVVASDGFFPFVDSLKLFKKAGISVIIQPGGSKADQKVIEYCNKNNLAMVFTGIRGFRH